MFYFLEKKILFLLLVVGFFVGAPAFASAATRYWVGGGSSANWNATGNTNWGSASGTQDNASVPGSSDDVIFDGAGGSSVGNSASTISASNTINSLVITSGYTGTLTHNSSITLTIDGEDSSMNSLGMGANMTYTPGATSPTINFTSTAGTSGTPSKITTNAKTMARITINSNGGYYKLQDNLTTTTAATLTLTLGTFNDGNYNVSIGRFSSSNSNVRSLIMGSGTWNVTGNNATVWNTITNGNFSFTRGNPVNFTYSGSTGTRTISGTTSESLTPDANISAGSDIVALGLGGGLRHLDFTGFTGTMTNNVGELTVYGNLTFSSGMTITDDNSSINMLGGGTQILTSNGITLNTYISIYGSAGGSVQLADHLNLGSTESSHVLNIDGTFDANNKNVTAAQWIQASGTVTMGSGTWTLSGTGTVLSYAAGTIAPGTSTLAITDISSTYKTIDGGGKTYGHLSITGAGSGAVIFTGANTFNNFTIGSPKTVTFPASTTTTITGTLSCTGSSGNVITINSSSSGTAATLSKASDTVTCDYLSLRDSTVTGGATWLAGTHSTSVSGNTGWTFDTTAPTAAITYSDTDGIVKSGDSLVITATFSEVMADSPVVKIAISGGNTLAATAMTKSSTTVYTYTHTVASGDGTATVAMSIGTDLSFNVITFAPLSGSTFTVDNTGPTVNAGSDQTSNSGFTQDATASDSTSGIASYSWTKTSGSGTITFGTPAAEDTTIRASAAETYVIRLTVTDNAGNSNYDEFTLIRPEGSTGTVTSSGSGGSATFATTPSLVAVAPENPRPAPAPTAISLIQEQIARLRQQLASLLAQETQTPNIPSPSRYLGPGDSGNDVLELQQFLQQQSFFPATITPNGYYGPATTTSVKAFQKAHGIRQTGNVGPLTKAALGT